MNGDGRHPLYAELTAVADAEGRDGDIQWNFEKFLVAPGGQVTRFGPMVTPEDDGARERRRGRAARLTAMRGCARPRRYRCPEHHGRHRHHERRTAAEHDDLTFE